MTDPERRRRRPAVSCSLCRRRKIRCDRKSPCNNCVRSKNEACIYETHPSDHPRSRVNHGQTISLESREGPSPTAPSASSYVSRPSTETNHAYESIVGGSTDATTPRSQASVADVEALKSRIKNLEEQLSKANQGPVQSSNSTYAPPLRVMNSPLCEVDSHLFGETQVITRSVVHKSRMFGQSHWINGVIGLCRDVFEMLEPHVRDETSDILSGMQRCKALARVIKSRRTPLWPSHLASALPSKDVADELVDCYLRTSETVYRVLHIPSFQKDYEALWMSDTAPDMAFMVQVKLVLAIGATVYDENFSLRASAIQWVYEAQTWFSEPVCKSRRSLQFLQINILLLIARELVNVGGDTIWTAAGALLRTAVYWGLHRDPAYLSNRTIFVGEMRRRLWNTILEMALHSSMACGAPVGISLDDFDTAPPDNYDDDQLVADAPVPKPEDTQTQVSVAIALRKTLPIRLAIVKFLNELGSKSTYEETLRLDAEFRVGYRDLCRALQRYKAGTGLKSHFTTHMVDCLMLRYLVTLHIPFYAMAPHETAYAYSRKAVVETSLRIWCALNPSSSIMAAHTRHDTASTGRNDFDRLAICGTGYLRVFGMQASLAIAAELSTQLQEEERLGPVFLRADLLSMVQESKEWLFRAIEAGETNIKGYLLIELIEARIAGLRQGLARDQLVMLLLKAAAEAEARCLRILEKMAAQGQTEGFSNGLGQMGLEITPDSVDDWDLMMTDVLLNQSTAEPMNWVYNEIPLVPLLPS
ncbi:hypothetical protein F9C07_5260 [Aspergillus flavus]|uniref:Zn(2)-C6 fungal-type domain-containing protein n=1 Tax=Aspergillus flavus (strain ATCC 200026 / FGSC A1120 / IAM 13836 / NRRL 3357 / JCM 12722 / SRRC 167) TaxID=332952 RepID=A0A7U2MWN4_ASPFN|nr:uncharacterized protein G4B84_010369 [Aspergillus flavus NRRL3357]KAF7623754.1 hypothetical protein AFLA_007480 [Aspergillus flavus NRRL3357]QMW34878.1 hypothetical protein G4B84_010369 [Aspergillus flavus NRRL3357]QRD91204.1 hypothetical protein F9C07_5260 [Aspergillus flavus]